MNILRTLAFSQEWFDLGIITPVKIGQMEVEWLTGEDTNPEHYRWRAFIEFLEPISLLDESKAVALYNLGLNDPDGDMGGSMMAVILRRKDCPQGLLELAQKSDEKFLRKIANEKLAAIRQQKPI